MKVQSLRLSSICFLVLLMFSLGGCNYFYLESCKKGNSDACEKACNDKETCMKACNEGSTYACAISCNKMYYDDLFACARACNGYSDIHKIYSNTYYIDKDFLLACKKMCDVDSDWDACGFCNVHLGKEYAEELCKRGEEYSCFKLCLEGDEDKCKFLCDTSNNCVTPHNHGDSFHSSACEKLADLKKKQEEKQAQQQEQERKRREEIYQKSPRGRCEKTCNHTYSAHSESWNYCMSACSQMRSDIGW